MGSRRVLGNDPFQRGAAERTPAATAPAAPAPPAEAPAEQAAPTATVTPPGGAAGDSSPARPRPARKPPEGSARPQPAKKTASAPDAPSREGAEPRLGTPPGKPSGPATQTEPPLEVPGVAEFVPEASPGMPPQGERRRAAPGGKAQEGLEQRRSAAQPPLEVPGVAEFIPEPSPGAPPEVEPPGPPAQGPPRAPEASTGEAREMRVHPAPPTARPAGPAPAVPRLTWTPLSEPAPVSAGHPKPPPGAPPAGNGGALVGALREAPGLLAEAWSALEAALRALRAGLGTAGGEQLDVYGRDARLSEAVAPLLDFLYSRWFRVEVEGAAQVPAGGALLVANHAGALPLDGPMLHEALRRERPDLPEARWLAEDQVFYAPLLGTLFNRLGAVRASPDSATRLLAEGRPVLIFPEGIQGIGKPFRDRYRLQRFGRGGFVKLALRTGKPILPVAIMGAEETLPLLGKLPGGLLGVPYLPVTGPVPLPAKWRIRIGEPIREPPGAKETDLSVVESLVDATRNTIEHMLRELLGARGGVFLG